MEAKRLLALEACSSSQQVMSFHLEQYVMDDDAAGHSPSLLKRGPAGRSKKKRNETKRNALGYECVVIIDVS